MTSYGSVDEADRRLSVQSNTNDAVVVETEPLVATATDVDKPGKPKSKRIRSVDAVRGIVIAVMILVDDAGPTFGGHMDHSPWNGITLADLVMPFFLFVIGFVVPVSTRKRLQTMSKRQLLGKAAYRALKLLVLGMLLQGSKMPQQAAFDLSTFRPCGILQRIAFAYFVVVCMELFLPRYDGGNGPFRFLKQFRAHWIVALLFTTFYLVIMLGTVPAGPAQCARGSLEPWCNAPITWDARILGADHLYNAPEYHRSPACSSCSPDLCPKTYCSALNRTVSDDFVGDCAPWYCEGYDAAGKQQPVKVFDPEGLVTTQATILSCWIGSFFAHISSEARVQHWGALSFGLVAAGVIIDVATPMKFNKQLWSPSYVLFNAGACGAMLLLFVLLIDTRWRHQKSASRFLAPWVWLGCNAILTFTFGASGVLQAMISWFYVGHPDNNLVTWFQSAVMGMDVNTCNWNLERCHDDWATLGFTLIKISFWIAVCGVLYKKKKFFVI